MSISASFQGAPSISQNATLYQHARETMRLVQEARLALQRIDNGDGLDLNREKGTVVTDKEADFSARLNLAGTELKPSFQAIQGQMSPGKLEATLIGDNCPAKILFHEDEQLAHYHLQLAAGRAFDPGALDVTENKLTGEITVRQENDFPWKFPFEPAYVTRENRFSPEGPQERSEVEFYQKGQELEHSIRAEIAQVSKLDNATNDLNPEAGLIVLAGHGYIPLEKPRLWDTDQVPSEVSLKREAGTDRVHGYSRGFGEHQSILYRREGETEIFQRREKGHYLRLEIHPDGTRLQQQLAQANFTDIDPQMLKQEATVSTALLPRLFNRGNALAIGMAACAAAFNFAAFGLVSGVLGASHPALFGALGASTAGLPLAFGEDLVCLNDQKLINGINRFHGSSPQAQMDQARKAIGSYKGRASRLELPTGANREDCIKFLSGIDAKEEFGDENGLHRLAILVDSYGPSRQPALVVIPRTHDFPIRGHQEGLQLFDGSVIPYGNIRELAEIRPMSPPLSIST